MKTRHQENGLGLNQNQNIIKRNLSHDIQLPIEEEASNEIPKKKLKSRNISKKFTDQVYEDKHKSYTERIRELTNTG